MMAFDDCKGSLPATTGLPAQPEGEKQREMPAPAGEATREALAVGTDDGARVLPGSGPLESSTEEIDIVRATMPIRIEPWRVAEDPEAHRKRVCAGKSGCRACALIDALYSTQRACAAMANLGARTLERADGAAFDGARLRGEKIASSEWPSRSVNIYALMRSAYPDVLSGIVAAVSKRVGDKWRTDRFDVLVRNDRSAARYRAETAPIPLRHADVRLIETETRDLFELHCSFSAGRSDARGKEWIIPLRAKDQRQYRDLHAIVSGSFRIGQLQIQRDRQGKNWELRIAYKRQVTRVSGDVLAAVNRGITCILAVVTESGESLIYDGRDIEAYLAQMQARRREYQRAYPLSGRKGHGRDRALRPTERLQGKAARWRKTRMQTIAREVARWLSARGVTRVLVDDLQGVRDGAVELLDGGKPVWDRIQSWPYYEMGQRLESCLQEYGIAVEKRPVSFVSRDCPDCGARNDDRAIGRRFVCSSCGYRRHVDVVAAMNLIARERRRGAQDDDTESQEISSAPRIRKRGARKPRGKSAETWPNAEGHGK